LRYGETSWFSGGETSTESTRLLDLPQRECDSLNLVITAQKCNYLYVPPANGAI